MPDPLSESHKRLLLGLWLLLYLIPYYLLFHGPGRPPAAAGAALLLLFLAAALGSALSGRRAAYFWTFVQILISGVVSVAYGYVYLSFGVSYFIGRIRRRRAFSVLYTLHLLLFFGAVNYCTLTQHAFFLAQFPFVILTLIGAILIPFNTYFRYKRIELQKLLVEANRRIAELVIQEERQRISRDLHDTLGQKLSLIGLKSELADKLIENKPAKAQLEIREVQTVARSTLKEVQELVSKMRGTTVREEVAHVRRILGAAEIEFQCEDEACLSEVSPLIQNVLSMCIKEAVTNVVKHSGASRCRLRMEHRSAETVVTVEDNGGGGRQPWGQGNGLIGMKERLDFVNGKVEIDTGRGTTVRMTVPHIIKQDPHVFKHQKG
ncbi:integral membrane sensor signal transduction histidine kinase [Paenibacillus mucilaginosus 3016]|uniref:histidine kinase n=1 Tax=Paenibacillus mucilaginosus 3016 TaxID=1116391 RepID=H6NCV1_9BACL|nr:sensor histidine kinase [Paenibacillus mucilaginosus]AFC29433.1 integral membrane sensor signal transduction histidine kinase [Paenibacillus mucilaginosus 3016]WFA18144.1 sensor histidine kinase [Paenibacillus mucilaginosus]